MKHISILIASILFSILFYDKSIGLNLSIFSLATIALLAFYNLKAFRNKSVLSLTVIYAVSAVLVFVHQSVLSIIANCVVFVTLVGMISETKSSIYVQWLNGLYSTIAGYFHRNFEVDNDKEKVDWRKNIDILHWSKLIGIPLIFIIAFILLYKNGNPIFEGLVEDINFNFINFQWLLFLVLGYFLFYNISKPVKVEPATSTDLSVTNILKRTGNASEEQLVKEQQLGTTLLGLLNALLIVFIVTDIISIVTSGDLLSHQMSSQVHKGVYTLIASIIMAIVIILYFFRGDFNFYHKNRTLKTLTYVWILLNMVLVILIAVKNYNYITTYGLTYKRIGVNVYLFLTLVGLATTFLKVLKIRNLVFLFRKNIQVAFITLLVLSAINWDYNITKYNMGQKQNFNIGYLLTLSNRNAQLLYSEKENLNISKTDKERIELKYKDYYQNIINRSWQEHSLESFRIANEK